MSQATMESRINGFLAELAIAPERMNHKNGKSSSGSVMAERKSRPTRRPQHATTHPLGTTYAMHGAIPIEYPFYNYIDYSTEADADPQTTLTAIGRVPTFPAKLHAILLRSDNDFKNIVTWLPHGRSWKVLNATEFEERVIPLYFEFTKHQYSSFFRQAKLWGFRRIKREGPDLDSYYNPRFLRGLPHLCKNLKRPSKLAEEHADMEPDLTVISESYPVPDNNITADPTINLSWFLNGRSDAEAYVTAAVNDTTPNPSALQSRKRSHDDAKNAAAPSQYHPPVPVSYNDTDSYIEEEMLHDDMGLKLDCFFSNHFDLYPFYDYEDCSREEDIDPWMPVTALGHNPSFPAKLHSILIRSDLSHIVAWLPHGRSWKIIDAREFETIVLPMYFDFSHQMYTSFVYEMKCWGFKRFPGEGIEQESYYHPRFLRGLPHLCKHWICESSIPIPEDSEPDEPDFDKISELFPLPDFRLTREDASSLHWYLLGRSV